MAQEATSHLLESMRLAADLEEMRLPYGDAMRSRADIVTRIREYRDVYGNREFALLMADACQYTREDMEYEQHEGIEPIERWGRDRD